jgi:DUF971 family protein
MKTNRIEIKNAEYLSNYKIRISFSDGNTKTIDFEYFLRKAKNPMTVKFLDMKKFKNFKIEYGDLLWGDYEMCFPLWDLYEGRI